ncbi:acylphosphatase [Nitratireductor sp. StC3]|uniref:acylphosphatase n=1 Tax=Nitratireductor sp. StC3 TaxID=2126741 RepID=UPI000D0D0891|nr:acylphosphatase [Nitratireductor sp. StC3]PSM18751.1 acylphosphatase [Nitratireductor sp. StC3]
MNDKHKAVVARITGRVQGVGYRAWTRSEAEALGLSGWVRNEADGSVTALIAGAPTRVEAMLARLRQGPRHASVARVAVENADPGGMDEGFAILG